MTGRGPTLIERGGPAEADGANPDLRHEVDYKAPANPTAVPPAGRRRGPNERPHYPGYGGHHRHYYGCGHYGYGYGYDPFYYGGYGYGLYSPHFYWGLGYWWPNYFWAPGVGGYGVYGGGGGGGGSSSYRESREVGQGAVDLDIRPGKAEIYVDGAYVGVADQFDGYPAYLWLDEGTYELTFYKEGYETISRQYTIYPGVTLEVDDRMRRGEATAPAGPVGDLLPQAGSRAAGDSEWAAPPSVQTRPTAAVSGDGGRIAIAASPGDAAVYLDGHFVGTASEIAQLGTGLIVEPGDHVVEIIRPGYESQRVPVSVTAGERLDLELVLRQ